MPGEYQLQVTRQLLQDLWQHYAAITPDAPLVHELLRRRGETFSNDHVALRTFDRPAVGIDRLSAPFVSQGYVASGDYRFEHKRLVARSFRHPSGQLPRLFISALRFEDFPERVAQLADALIAQVPADLPAEQLLVSAPTWGAISFADYSYLAGLSEYAAWVAAFGIRVNHFTVHFNDLRSFDQLADLNAFVEAEGFELNGDPLKIQGGPKQLLEQSSTVARMIPWHFANGEEHAIPGGYYEFARRYVDPSSGSLFDGFVTASADRIFESTNARR